MPANRDGQRSGRTDAQAQSAEHAPGPGDPVEQAIKDAEPKGNAVEMAIVKGNMPSGRPYALHLPSDLTDMEALWVVSQVGAIYEQLQQRGRPRILVARGPVARA